MTLAKGDGFTRIAHAFLVLGLIALVAEVHSLRVAVDDAGLLASMTSTPSLENGDSLDRSLGDLARHIDALAAVLDRPRLFASKPVAVEGDAKMTQRPGTSPGDSHNPVKRRPFTVDWQARLESLATTLEKLDPAPRVRRASLPPPQSSASVIEPRAVLDTIAALRNAPEKNSALLMMTREQLLERYGKPSSINFGEGRGEVRWWYELSGGSHLSFSLYEGRVIRVSSTE